MLATLLPLALGVSEPVLEPAAAALRLDLTYVAAPPCPDRDAFVAALGRDLAASVVLDDAAHSQVAIWIARTTDAGWRLALAVLDDGEVRSNAEWTDASCDALVGVAALQVSLALQSEVASQPPPPAPAPSPAPMPVPSPTPAPPPRSQPSPSRPALGLRVAGGIEGFGAGFHGLLAAAVTRRVGPVHLELRGSWAAPTRYALSDERSAGVRVQVGWIAPIVCHRAGIGRVYVPLCGGVELGVVRGRGFGIPSPATDHALWVALLVRTGVHVELARRWAVFVDAEAAPVLVRPGVRVRGLGTGYRAGPLSGRLWAGLELAVGPWSRRTR